MTWPGPATVVAEMATVGVQDLALYLRKKGWQRVRHPNERLLVFERECHEVGTDALRIVLAASDDYEDGKARMADAIELLAAIQQVSPAEVLRSVHALDRDIVTVRFTGLGSLQGGLPLDTATRLVSQLRELFAYAACVEENPRPYFARATAIGRSFTERCLFGHTFAGSFGFTIESPTGPGALVLDGAGAGTVDAPFPRRVVSRIVRGIRDLQEAMLSGEPDLLVARYETGLNANLCEVLQETLGEPDDHEMEYGVTWAPEWPVAGDLAAVRRRGSIWVRRPGGCGGWRNRSNSRLKARWWRCRPRGVSKRTAVKTGSRWRRFCGSSRRGGGYGFGWLWRPASTRRHAMHTSWGNGYRWRGGWRRWGSSGN